MNETTKTRRRALSVGTAAAVLVIGGALAWALASQAGPAATASAEGAATGETTPLAAGSDAADGEWTAATSGSAADDRQDASAATDGARDASSVADVARASSALGNTLGNNDTATRGAYDVYDPEAEAEATGGTEIEGSDEEKLQQERIAGGSVGEVVSQNLPELDGVVNEDKSDYTPVFGDEFQAPDLPQAVLDAVEGGELTGLPKNHLTANLSIDECADCHAVVE